MTPASLHPRRLTDAERPRLAEHFLLLDADDLRLRFGMAKTPDALADYVARGIDFGRDGVFAIDDDDLALLGVAHVAIGPGMAEFGVSVLAAHRGQRLGSALLARAHNFARSRFIPAMFMHCLTENRAMMHMARKAGMEVATESGEADAWVKLAKPDAGTMANELLLQRVAVFDHALKAQLAAARGFSAAWKGTWPLRQAPTSSANRVCREG